MAHEHHTQYEIAWGEALGGLATIVLSAVFLLAVTATAGTAGFVLPFAYLLSGLGMALGGTSFLIGIGRGIKTSVEESFA